MEGVKDINLKTEGKIGDHLKVISFDKSSTPEPPAPEPPVNAVDIGLSIRWRDRNLGAIATSDYGYYFAWGETEPKSNYSATTYTDNPTVLPPEHDATSILGEGWRTPTVEEYTELLATYNNSDYEWTWKTIDSHSGYEIKYLGNNNSIFIPASGYKSGTGIYVVNTLGDYWTSSIDTDPNKAQFFVIEQNNPRTSSIARTYGFAIRPIYCA